MDLPTLVNILQKYIDDLDESDDHLKVEGKNLVVANHEQAAWFAYYDARRVELKKLVKWMEMQVASVRSKEYKRLTENFSVDLTSTAKERYIDSNQKYLEYNQLFLEVEEVYERYASIVKAFEQRGYALRNITNIKTSQLGDVDV